MHKYLISLLIVGITSPAFAQQPQLGPVELAEQQAQAVVPGATRVSNIYQAVAQKNGDRTDWLVMLQQGQCYWFSAAGGPGVRKIAVYLWNPTGKRMTDQRANTPAAIINHCPAVGGLYKVQAKVTDGAGLYALGVYTKAAPPIAAAPPPTPEDTSIEALCDKYAGTAAPGASRQGEVFESDTAKGDRTDWSALLEPGKCYWMIGVGEPGKVSEVSAYLWGPDNKRITDSRAKTNMAMVAHCPVARGMYKVQVKVTSGGGKYGMCIYAK